jgi:hypothetical protein
MGKLMKRTRILFVILVLILGCSTSVRQDKIFGTYLASYPFGTERIVLNIDGTFIQRVVVNNEEPVVVTGHWKFNPSQSRVNLYDSMVVVDGFGNLRADWRSPQIGVASMDVEMHWFKIVMGSASKYPYMKQ